MGSALSHRGPDAEGLHRYPGGGLAHRRLAVIDCSEAANQPFAWDGGRYHLVYNGELYNFPQLRQELQQLGTHFRTRSDTEVLAAALAQWGVEALLRLNGIFAFAWHDAADGSLLLARDRLGVKPLFYTQQAWGFAFASELSALKAGAYGGAAMDREALDAYLMLQYIPAPRTIYAGVHKLRAGHWMRLSGQRMETRPYWSLEYHIDSGWTLDSAAERYRELLRDSVRMQRVSDVPLGAFLSGGIDSSTVTAVLAEEAPEPVRTFTIGFEEGAADERGYARIAATRFGTRHQEAVARPDVAGMLPELVPRFGEPFADSSALPMWMVSKLAREHVTVALSGDGGDELFAGYAWLHGSMLAVRMKQMPGPLRAMAKKAAMLLPGPRGAQVLRLLGDAALSPPAVFARRLGMFNGEQRLALLGAPGGWDPVAETWAGIAGGGDMEKMLGTDTLLYLPDDILTKVDRMSMAHALEVRVPLLDHRIVEFAATVPFALKYARGESKRLVKHTFRDVLPAELLRQRKRGFALPIDAWFRAALGERFREEMVEATPLVGDVLEVGVVRKMFAEHCQRRENHGHRLWAILVLEEWLRQEAATR